MIDKTSKPNSHGSKDTRQGSKPGKEAEATTSRDLRITLRFSSESELESLEQAAQESGFSTGKQSGVSSYIKRVALGYEPSSVFDQQVIEELANIHADLGRIGGLFKLGIMNGVDFPEMRETAREMLRTKNDLQALIRDIRAGDYGKP